MCNPLWSQLFAPCTLDVFAENVTGDPVITAVVTVNSSGGDRRENTTLPVRIDLDSGEACRVAVNVSSMGSEAAVTIRATISGGDSREDICEISVDESHPLAHETIMASTR